MWLTLFQEHLNLKQMTVMLAELQEEVEAYITQTQETYCQKQAEDQVCS